MVSLGVCRIWGVVPNHWYPYIPGPIFNKALKQGHYPDWAMKCASPSDNSTTRETVQLEPKDTLVVPYVQGFSEKRGRILMSYGWRVSFKPMNNLRQALVEPRDKFEPKDVTGVVYCIPCQGTSSRGLCEEFYIGETERTLKPKFLEYKRPSTTGSEVS